MIVATRKPLMDSGYRNLLRHPPASSVLYLPGLPEGRSQTRIPDLSGNGNHGTITGALWTKLPSGLSVLSLNGTTDYISFGALGTLSALTFLLWLKRTGDTAALEQVLGPQSWGANACITLISIGASDNQIQFGVNGNTPSDVLSTGTITADSKYHFLGITYNVSTKTVVIYIDDAAGESTALTTAVNAVFNDAWIGIWTTSSRPLQAEVAIAQLINTNWTAAQIANYRKQTRHLFRV